MPTFPAPPAARSWTCSVCDRPLGDHLDATGKRTRGRPSEVCPLSPGELDEYGILVTAWEMYGKEGAKPRKPISDCAEYKALKERFEELAPKVFGRMSTPRFRLERSDIMSMANRRAIIDECKAAATAKRAKSKAA